MRLNESSIQDKRNENVNSNLNYIPYQSKSYLELQKKQEKLKRNAITVNSNKITNLEISRQFGQNNFEKALLLICIIILINGISNFLYYHLLSRTFIWMSIGSIGIELVLFTILSFFYFRLKQEKVFNTLPHILLVFVDILCVIYIILSVVILVLLQAQQAGIACPGYWLFIIKFIIAVYFVVVTYKMLNFSGCSYAIQGMLKKAWVYVSYYIFCMEEEANTHTYHDYQEFDEFDSEY